MSATRLIQSSGGWGERCLQSFLRTIIFYITGICLLLHMYMEIYRYIDIEIYRYGYGYYIEMKIYMYIYRLGVVGLIVAILCRWLQMAI